MKVRHVLGLTPGTRHGGRAAALLLVLALADWGRGAGPVARSKVFPLRDEGKAYLLEQLPNAANIAYPIGEGATAEQAAGYHAVVEVPAYLELTSNTYAYSRRMPKPRVESIERDGRPYRRYTFAPLSHRNYRRWASFFTHWTPKPTAVDRKTPGVFAWRFHTPDGLEPEQRVPIELLPELPPTPPLQRYQVRLWQSSITNVEPKRLHEVLVLLQRSGFNQVPYWESRVEDLRAAGAAQLGLKVAADQSGHHGWPEAARPSPGANYRNRDFRGREVERQDLQWVIDSGGAPWKNDLAYCRRHASRLDVISQDNEWNVSLFTTGFSPAGIRAFAARAKLDPPALTPETIWRNHRKAWYDFRAWQTLKVVSYYLQATREGNPGATMVFLPGGPYITTDPNLLSEMVELGPDDLGRMVYLILPFPLSRMQEAMDAVMPMWYGHGRTQCRNAFAWSRALAPRIPVPLTPAFLGQGREFYYTGGDPGPVLRALGWSAALGGAKGWCYWLGEFSALQLSWLARLHRELVPVEDLLFDGRPDPRDVVLEPLPKKRVSIMNRAGKRAFTIPDFAHSVVSRSFARGVTRFTGIVNLDAGYDVYYRLRLPGLSPGRYRVRDLAKNALLCPGVGQTDFDANRLKAGIPVRTPAGYGVSLILVTPAGATAPEAKAGSRKLLVPDITGAYAAYREPDSEVAGLAQRGRLVIRHDVLPKSDEPAILVESPAQQVWIQPQRGGIISRWRVKNGSRLLVMRSNPSGGAGMDLFWVPPEAKWSGDEKSAYELVYAKIHGGKAHVRLRQAKSAPSVQGLVVTKTYVVPERGAEVEVKLVVRNEGPAPILGYSLWVHHMFQLGSTGSDGPANVENPTLPQLVLATDAGPTVAPLKDLVWAKPDAPFLPGNEEWERKARNGVTTGEWIAQRDPTTGAAVLCQNEGPPVVQFYSWRDPVGKRVLSLEWMYPYVRLEAGREWRASYVIRYVGSAQPAQLPKYLLRSVQ